MKAPVRAICTRPVAMGLALAGITPVEAETGEEAAAAIDELVELPAAGGVIFIERALLDQLPPATMRRIRRAGAPILIPFPGPALGAAREKGAEDEILEILRQAVGYRLRLR
jgi:vacuolar-type H+-ATPase subunit F/Vma7